MSVGGTGKASVLGIQMNAIGYSTLLNVNRSPDSGGVDPRLKSKKFINA